MSKAFTRESDDLPVRPTRARPASGLPPGATNYLTAEGAERLRAELDRLLAAERSPADDARLEEVQCWLDSATVVPPLAEAPSEVRFGVTVTVRFRDGKEARIRIVGVYETDLTPGWVSWLSPTAKALLHMKRGALVSLPTEAGTMEAEITALTHVST